VYFSRVLLPLEDTRLFNRFELETFGDLHIEVTFGFFCDHWSGFVRRGTLLVLGLGRTTNREKEKAN
jgi:hypothetical protein